VPDVSTRVPTVLLVDQDDAWREAVANILKADYRVLRASSGESALAMLMREDVDAMLVDVDQPGISGFETLRIARENFELTEVIVTAAHSDVDHAIEAVKLGAFHFVPKSGGPAAVRSLVDRALERQTLARQVQVLSAEAADTTEREFVVGPSRAVHEVVDVVRRVARLSATVLILGESGTGKELLARLLHRESEAPEGPFVAVNLAAIPQELVESVLFGHEKGAFTGAVRQQIGKFELANGGTLFLDEIGDLRLDLQAKLLRAIQEGEIERIGSQRPIKATFRLIAATNVDLEKAVKDGRFRDDLYYRINVIPIKLPPLRERVEDLPELARFFLRRYNTKFRKHVEGISDAALRMLTAYWWPGNIRELENLIERLVAIIDKAWITEDDLPFEFRMAELDRDERKGDSLFQEAMTAFERNLLVRALERNGWNVTGTARYLGLPLSTLKFKLEKLDVREFAKRLRGN
jgi:two-component system, NtrC family, response regulator HydG